MPEQLAGTPAPALSDHLRGRQLPHIGHLTREELNDVIHLGEWMRDNRYDTTHQDLLKGRVQALLFVYPSTRTRVGFETAMAQLGGTNIYLPAENTQMGRGESIEDTARALDQYVDVFTGRLWKDEDIDAVCKNMTGPVLNACTPRDHSTHVIGELMAIKQAKGSLEGLTLVYTGMARGILHSFIRACPVLDVHLVLGIPESYAETVDADVWKEGQMKAEVSGTRLEIVTDMKKAVEGADFIQASTLMRSMLAGEQSPEEKAVDIPRYTVTDDLLGHAKPDALYSHSGPAHRNVCATDSVLDGPRSRVREEAHNAIFAKKALLALMVR
jgi:ornithine carbamoyltransferase